MMKGSLQPSQKNLIQTTRFTQVKSHLDLQLKSYHRREFLNSDPLEFVHRFKQPKDQEMVGLIAALIAYGNAKQIRKSIAILLDRLGEPGQFMKDLNDRPSWNSQKGRFEGFIHRFNIGKDFYIILRLLQRTWNEHESLGALFDHHAKNANLGDTLSEVISLWRLWAKDRKWLGVLPDSSFHYMLNSPRDGSCCKRWCMYLKWMIRKDEIDLGTWSQFKNLNPADLVIPVDTHIARVSRHLGLTHRKSMNWKAAIEITEALKRFNPADPTIYDFALTRPGIMKVKER